MELPFSYILDKFYHYAGKPTYNRSADKYNGSCPICHEGKSWLKKKRCYLMARDRFFFCHNCQKSWSALRWISEVTGMTYREIYEEAESYADSTDNIIRKYGTAETVIEKPKTFTLPQDSINLTDCVQMNFYKDNKVVQDMLKYINSRRLFTAINRPKTFYVSLKDYVHKNRLVIPFRDDDGKIIFYQTRSIYKDDKDLPKYLSKSDADFTVYGIDNINRDVDTIFLFEGPIDAMFVVNGLGMGGLKTNSVQEQQLQKYKLYERIWVLDNQMDNDDVTDKYDELIEKGEKVFCMPKKYKEFKDMNELCVCHELDQIPAKFIRDNSFTGMQAKMRLKELSD